VEQREPSGFRCSFVPAGPAARRPGRAASRELVVGGHCAGPVHRFARRIVARRPHAVVAAELHLADWSV